MSTFSPHYHHFAEQQVYVDPHALAYEGYGLVYEKTPTDSESLVNHSGHSPLPLTTTPPLRGNPSRPPEPSPDYVDPMLWDNGSGSNSPTVKTPDGESFEVEMLDSDLRDFYVQTDVNMSTQVSHNAIPAVAPNVFINPQNTLSDLALQNALNASMASRGQQYFPHYNQQTPQTHHLQSTSPHHNAFSQSYTAQPTQHDPWSGQRPSRSSVSPVAGGVIFDPATDPVDYGQFFSDSDLWPTTFLSEHQFGTSPNGQLASPHENFPGAQTHGLPLRPQVYIPQAQTHNHGRMEMHLTSASPPPDDQNFVNYDVTSSLFTNSYPNNSQYSPSSPGNTSIGYPPHSPFQPTISPSAVSPGSSDGYLSFHQQDTSMMIDSFTAQPRNQIAQLPQSAPMKFSRSTDSHMAFSVTPDPEVPQSDASAKAMQMGKSGGRALGTHLEPKVAKEAHDMRKITACWHCVLQRDKCGPGDICDRCLKRSQRPNADCGLGCSRIKLVDLAAYFLPGLVTKMHEDSHLTRFVSQFIHTWNNVELTVYMTCGQSCMPRIPVKVYEFRPIGNELLVQTQYVIDPHTKLYVKQKKQSPALGMVHINHNEEKIYDRYISDIVDNHLDAFSKLCWMEDENDFQERLFKLMIRVKAKSDDEAKLLREVYRLIVVTYIMSHTLTIAEETKLQTLQRMHSYTNSNAYVQDFTSPRMTNRQLKYFFSRLQRNIQTTVLNKLQQIFKSSKGCDKWLAAFVALLGLCMALEDQQKTIHCVMATRSETDGTDARDAQAEADFACREIDQRIHFVQQIFRWKYNRKHNPMVNADHDWEKESGFGDKASVGFVRQVAQLVKENTDYLQQQQRVSISYDNQNKYSSRLVGQFLLSFWLPNA